MCTREQKVNMSPYFERGARPAHDLAAIPAMVLPIPHAKSDLGAHHANLHFDVRHPHCPRVYQVVVAVHPHGLAWRPESISHTIVAQQTRPNPTKSAPG